MTSIKTEKGKKEILSNLLKQLLEHNLSRLEKRNITEIKDFNAMTSDAQKLILTLEDMSHSVRKEICVQRQKYINDENKQKASKITKGYPKSPKVMKKSISTRKLSKFNPIDSRSNNRYEALQTDINNRQNKSQIISAKSKSKGKALKSTSKPKISNVNISSVTTGRKTVGTVNLNKTNLIPHSKVRRPVSPFIPAQEKDKLNKTMGSKPGSIAQRKSSAQKKGSVTKGLDSKAEKIRKKSASKLGNKTNDKTPKKINKININSKDIDALEKLDNNNLDDSRIKVLDVFRQSQKKGTNSNINDNLNINSEIKNKKDDKCPFLQTLSKEFGKVGTIKIDDTALKDSLLVTNNLNGEVSVNMGDLFRGSTIKEIELDNKKENNKDNNNEINKKDKKDLNNSKLIYDKLKRTKITFLEDVHDFDLIFKDSKIEDINLGFDLNENKDADLNTTQISDHMSLEEKFETNLDIISRYLDNRDICNLMLINKECFKTLISILISKSEISSEILEEEINKLKELNPNMSFDNIKKKPFKLNVNSMRAISLLNSSSGNNILKLSPSELNQPDIILVYSLYFVATGKKKDIALLMENEKIEFMQNYFKKNNPEINSLGTFLEKELNGKVLEDNVISALYNMSKNHLNIISPNYFQKINKDIAIFVFLIKDLLEQLGLLGSQFIKPEKEFILLNSRLQTCKAVLSEFNKVEEHIYENL